MSLTMSAKGRAVQGSLAVEAVLTLWFFLLLVGAFVETARRGWYEIRGEWEAFVLSRSAVIQGPVTAQAQARRRLAHSFRYLVTEQRSVNLLVFPKHLRAEVYIRFPSLYRFAIPGDRSGVKHGFEMSRRCTLSFR